MFVMKELMCVYTFFNRACGLVDACQPVIAGSKVQTRTWLFRYSLQQGDYNRLIC